jgi:hypothetical protein
MESFTDARNRLLRRADWRFLTGTPAPEVSVTFGDGPLCDAVRSVSQRTISGATRPVECADLAVARDPDRAMLAAAVHAVRPGGFVSIEWTPSRTRTPAAIRRAMRRAGVHDIRIYAAAANEPRWGEALLPVGAAPAMRWHLRRTHPEAGIRATFHRGMRVAAWQIAGAVSLGQTMQAIGRKGAAVQDSFEAVRRAVLRAARMLDARERDESDLWVLLAPGMSALNKVVLLALGEDGAPRCAIKSTRTMASAEGIRREAAVLEAVHAGFGDLPGVPRVLLAGDCAGVAFVAETPIDGVAVSHIVEGEIDDLLERAARWQARLIDRAGRLSRDQRSAALRTLLDYADRQFGAGGRDLVRAMRAMTTPIEQLPIASEQRDFSPWNVFVTPSGELAAVDWESGDACGWPALDLIYFLTYVSAYREGAYTREGLLRIQRATVAGTGEAGAIAARCLAQYAALSGVPPEVLPALRALCWLVHSYAEHRRLTAERGAAPGPGELRDSLFAVLWEQELRAGARLSAA